MKFTQDFYSLEKVAEMFGRSISTVKKWVRTKKLVAFRMTGNNRGTWVCTREDVKSFFENNYTPVGSEAA